MIDDFVLVLVDREAAASHFFCFSLSTIAESKPTTIFRAIIRI